MVEYWINHIHPNDNTKYPEFSTHYINQFLERHNMDMRKEILIKKVIYYFLNYLLKNIYLIYIYIYFYLI